MEAPPEPRDGGLGSLPPAGPCDLSGRWIVTERLQSSAYGAQQVSRVWFYFELSQQGDAVTIAKSLMCGCATTQAPGEVFSINVDESAAWPSYQRFVNFDGRKGTSQDTGGACAVSFEPGVFLRALTVDYYKDTSHPLPTLDQKEDGANPGWADWDGDGNPGISQVITGTASGTLYTATRFTTVTLSGSVPSGAQSFKLDNFDWRPERVVLGTREPDPIGILSSPTERNPAAGLNYVEFARLAEDQATGSDDDVCKSVRMLLPTLNPSANPQ